MGANVPFWLRPVSRWGVLVAIVVSAVALATGAEVASACSCEQVGTDADTVEFVDVAFVGRVVSTETLDEPDQASGDVAWDLRYRVRVVDAVKGVAAGQLVVIHGSSSGTLCGTNTLSTQGDVAVAVTDAVVDGRRRFLADVVGECGRPATVEGFRALARDGAVGPVFASPNIEPVGAPDVLPAPADPVSERRIFVSWWVLMVVGAVAAAGAAILLVRRRA